MAWDRVARALGRRDRQDRAKPRDTLFGAEATQEPGGGVRLAIWAPHGSDEFVVLTIVQAETLAAQIGKAIDAIRAR